MRAPLGEEGGTVAAGTTVGDASTEARADIWYRQPPRLAARGQVEATIAEAGLAGLDAELRFLSQGLASFAAHYDYVAELSGRLADDVVKAAAG